MHELLNSYKHLEHRCGWKAKIGEIQRSIKRKSIGQTGPAINHADSNDRRVCIIQVITRRSVSSAIVRMQMTATLAADSQTLQ